MSPLHIKASLAFLIFLPIAGIAQRITGTVRDAQNQPLAHASVLIKGTTRGTTTNSQGIYFLELSGPGSFTILAQHVGYKRESAQVVSKEGEQIIDFKLQPIDLMMQEVVVRSGENPANSIIRNTINKRKEHQEELKSFSCEVYTKGMMKLRDHPDKFMGTKVDFEDGDTSKQRIIYLSETIARYFHQHPNKTRIEVVSSRVSGSSDGYGLAAPQFYSIYDNNIRIGNNLNPRGFISPIADNALSYYRYRYEGAFFEDGRQVNRIRVIPRRKYEPLFSGHLYIIEDEWRIHSLQLLLSKESQMEILDTLRLEQTYMPLKTGQWFIQNQLLYPAVKFLGFEGYGNFVNIYSDVEVNPVFEKKFFTNTILVYTDSANRKTPTYWEDIRPLKLLDEEIKDYRKKDSLERISKNPSYLDSLDRVNNKLTIPGLLLTGNSISKRSARLTFYIPSVTEQISFNIVEGISLKLSPTIIKHLDSTNNRRRVVLSPTIRYGISNRHFNASMSARYYYGRKYINSLRAEGGKQVYQFNNASPISARSNTVATLMGERNLLKLYEAWFFTLGYTSGLGKGVTGSLDIEFQDRLPLENREPYSFRDVKDREFTPNYPTELISSNFSRHQVFRFTAGLSWQPGARYIEFPDRVINLGSRWPTFSLAYTRALSGIMGSDGEFSKWRMGLTDIIPLRMLGLLNYRLGMGGFLGSRQVQVPDYQHFNGNISRIATPYLNSFQLLPIYEFSNTSKFYVLGHMEYHLNGFLTNKIPGFRKLNWYLVTSLNGFRYQQTGYSEIMVGVENILRSFRVDYAWSFVNGKRAGKNIRIGIRGGISSLVSN